MSTWTRTYSHPDRPGHEREHRLAETKVTTTEIYADAEDRAQEQDFESALRAKWEFDKLCHRTEASGWTEVGGGEPHVPVSRDDFEAELRANPNEVEIRLVYGDWLSQAGDPWGELIATQHAIDSLPRLGVLEERRRLRRHETQVMFQHARRFWGRLGTTVADVETQMYLSDRIRAVWESGFLVEATVNWTSEPLPMSFSDFVRILAGLDTAMLLRHLRLRCDQWSDDLVEAVGAVPWPQLETLEILLETESGLWEPFDGAVLEPLVCGPSSPRLENLVVYGTHNTDSLCEQLSASPIAPRLRKLRLHDSQFTERGITALAKAPLSQLQELRLSGTGLEGASELLAAKAPRVMVDPHLI